MDQMTPFEAFERADSSPSDGRRTGRRTVFAILLLPVLGAAAALGFQAGQAGWALPEGVALPGWAPAWLAAAPGGAGSASGPIVYYRDPDGKPAYSAGPRTTADGRDYVAVQASEDVSFDEESGHGAHAEAPVDQGSRRILYYRNPMGLPDTSPVPKKDSMGMDYIPVHEGEADDGSTVRITPGRLQRTGVRSEIVERRVVTRPVRVPGTVQLDERRVTVVSTRSDTFIEHVENVTTGDRVRKGQPLLHLYSPEIAAASGLDAAPGTGKKV